MRVAFLGTAGFGIPTLEALHSSPHEVVGVVTGPDKQAGRGRKLKPSAVRVIAESLGLNVLTPKNLKNKEFIASFSALKPDAAVVVAFRILPPEVFNIPKSGTLNIHPSLLPAYRGPAPINWAIINGEEETGISIIKISDRIDAGGVLLQKRFSLLPDETAGELSERLANAGGKMMLEVLNNLASSTLTPLSQDESLVTRAPKLKKEDGHINWNQPAAIVYNHIRGVTPYPGAYTLLGKQWFKLYLPSVVPGTGIPGEILEVDKTLTVACSDKAISFMEIQRQGKKRMSVSDFRRGYDLPPGTILGE
ncbi:MAG: methionyl-tRNA formyltransferase [Candidatus Electryonea clarkiae]|nr:methionyl-tRNA formyltransferase [Candidatus Electryonea clarkiae]MDP8286872.1 methionyl-tRNA formyltransferase [Candidatus Electryonea clarkiae]